MKNIPKTPKMEFFGFQTWSWLKYSKINGPPNFGLFDFFLDEEQEFIPKMFYQDISAQYR